MNRRAFLNLIATGIAGATLDPEKLLWIPGQKTIFLPTEKYFSVSEIVAIELNRIIPMMRELFERDDKLYNYMSTYDIINGRLK